MFDPQTTILIRQAPSLPNLNRDRLPEELTKAFAEIVSFRIRVGRGRARLPEDLTTSLDRFRRLAATFRGISRSATGATRQAFGGFRCGSSAPTASKRASGVDPEASKSVTVTRGSNIARNIGARPVPNCESGVRCNGNGANCYCPASPR